MQQHRFKLIEGNQSSGLPVLATPGDVREVVQLLKARPEGIPIVEATDAVRKRLFDARKVTAYELWGIISRVGDRIKLDLLGWELARTLEPQARIFRTILDDVKPYRAMLELIQRKGLELVTFADVANYWEPFYPEPDTDSAARDLESGVACFFQLCHAADIGTATAGRKGQPTRLRVNQKGLASFLRHYPAHPESESASEEESLIEAEAAEVDLQLPVVAGVLDPLKVFISFSEPSMMVDRLQEALKLSGMECEAVQRDSSFGNPVAPATLEAMLRCQIGLILVTSADLRKDAAGNETLSTTLQIEIGSAFVHFARKVVLLWSKHVPMADSLKDLSRCEFEGDELNWDTGIEVLRALKLVKG